jgi:hypothetical protein
MCLMKCILKMLMYFTLTITQQSREYPERFLKLHEWLKNWRWIFSLKYSLCLLSYSVFLVNIFMADISYLPSIAENDIFQSVIIFCALRGWWCDNDFMLSIYLNLVSTKIYLPVYSLMTICSLHFFISLHSTLAILLRIKFCG